MKAKATTFHEWYESEFRPEWKLVSVEKTPGPVSQRVEETLKAGYGVKKIQSGIKAPSAMFSKGDWILEFTLRGESPGRPTWMFADFTVKVPRSDKEAYDPKYPYQVVQVWPTNRYAGRPFMLDSQFRAGFSRAVREYGASKISETKSAKIPSKLLQLIYNYCRQ